MDKQHQRMTNVTLSHPYFSNVCSRFVQMARKYWEVHSVHYRYYKTQASLFKAQRACGSEAFAAAGVKITAQMGI
jgi:hypothetical protein